MGTTCIPAMLLRQRAGDLLARVHYAGERFIIERHGEAVAALVSIDDLHRLEAAEQLSLAQRTQRQAALTQAQSAREAILVIANPNYSELRTSGRLLDNSMHCQLRFRFLGCFSDDFV